MKASFDIDFRAQRAEPLERSAYRRARGQDPIATAAALALVGLVGSAFIYMSPIFVKKQVPVATVVTLLTLPNDPPLEQPQPEPDKTLPPPVAILTPPPQVLLPQPAAPQIAQVEVAKPTPPAPQLAPAPPAPAPRGPENLGEISAKMISAKPPRYPLDSKRSHEEGTVVLSVLLSTDGRVVDISVARSSGSPRLDRAALDAVRDWRWSPVVRDGSPVTARGVVSVNFNLQGGNDRRGGDDRRGGGRHHRDHDGDGPDTGPGQDQTTA